MEYCSDSQKTGDDVNIWTPTKCTKNTEHICTAKKEKVFTSTGMYAIN